jgi:hypothetical protein
MKKLLKRIGDAMRYCLHGVVKTHRGQPEPRDDMRVVKSPEGTFAIEAWSRWGGWTFYGFTEYCCEQHAREAMDAAKKHRAERIARESKSWTPLNES